MLPVGVDKAADGPLQRLGDEAPFSNAMKFVENRTDLCCYTLNPNAKPDPCDNRSIDPIKKWKCVPKVDRKRSYKFPKPKCPYERIILFRPVRWRCKEKTEEKIAVQIEPSLGSPIGLSLGAYNLIFFKPAPERFSLLTFATCLIAFGEYFITPEVEWDTNVINRVLQEGVKLLENSTSEDVPLTESTVKKFFVLCGNTMEIDVDDPFLIGRVTSEDARIQNLHWGLVRFFRKHKHCLLQIGTAYYLLWRNLNAFFIFDPSGRDKLHFNRNLHEGLAMLICLKSVENISHLLLNLSNVRPDDMFTIRRLKMVSLLPCCAKTGLTSKERRAEYIQLNENHAVLKGHLHLGQPCFNEFRYKQSLAVSMIALIYAKIDPSCIWTSLIVDEIILLGTTFFKELTQCDFSADFCVQDLPSRFQIGQFTLEVRVKPMDECGMWQCVPNYRESDLTKSLQRSFEKHSYLLVQIDRRSFPLWRKGDFYYMFDGYSHQCSVDRDKLKTAAVHMCRNLDTLCCVLTQSILEISSPRHFLVHVVTVLKIRETTKYEKDKLKDDIPCSCIAREVGADDKEVMSLNESILDLRCKRDIDCLIETNIIEEDVPDLDSPGMSETQLVPDFRDFKKDLFEDDEDADGDKDSETPDTDGDDGVAGNDSNDDLDLSEDGGDPSASGLGGKKSKKKKDKGDKGGKGKGKDGKDKSGAGDKDKDGEDPNDKDAKGKKKGKDGKSDGEDDEDPDGKGGKGDKSKDDKTGQGEENIGGEVHGDGEGGSGLQGCKSVDRLGHTERGGEEEDEAGAHDGRPKSKCEERFGKGHGGLSEEDDDEKQCPDFEALEESVEEIFECGEKPRGRGKGSKEISPCKVIEEKVRREREEKNRKAREKKERMRASRRLEEDGHEASDEEFHPSESRRTREKKRSSRRSTDVRYSTDQDRVYINPNRYPGFSTVPHNLAVVGSETGSYESLCGLIRTAFKCADRILIMTPWGNYVVFSTANVFLLFDGCTCNVNRFRHLDLRMGTAGLLSFKELHDVITYIRQGKELRKCQKKLDNVINDICDQYCEN